MNALLGQGDLFIFGTTRATNAIVTGSTARTALIVTKGHPDILLFREGGGRKTLFDYTQEYPEPYIPRSLTYEVPERIGSDGAVVIPLDEEAMLEIAGRLRAARIEAVAVSLLWSIVNPSHEVRVAELLSEHLPGVPFTLGHQLNPTIREYRRTSAAALDASLKPLMSEFFSELGDRLRTAGFDGRLLIVTASGGVLDAAEVASAPIHSIGSGPAAAPIAGRHFARADAGSDTAIVTDAGGTTYDVSLIRRGQVPRTRESMVGDRIAGYMTGFPAVDVRSIGAGGGSIARVDSGGMLHVGPQSAGADPGPASYGRGGRSATVTDACVVLGYIDPEYFLGGEMPLSVELARDAVRRDVGVPLDLDNHSSASAILELAIENMVRAIEEMTLQQGIDPRSAIVIGGGGGAGLYSVGIARRLNSPQVVIPAVSAALSATGALISELQRDFAITSVMTTAAFDFGRANSVLAGLEEQAAGFIAGPGAGALEAQTWFTAEARYPHQVWEIEVPLPVKRFASAADLNLLLEEFHRVHEEVFAVSDTASAVEVVTWRAHVRCTLRRVKLAETAGGSPGETRSSRLAYFSKEGMVETPVIPLANLGVGEVLQGPALIESSVTTVVIDPLAAVERVRSGSLVVWPDRAPAEARKRVERLHA